MLDVHHLFLFRLQIRQHWADSLSCFSWTNQRLLPPLHLRGNERGMSLIELLVTLWIVAITGGVILPRINSQSFNAKLTVQNLLGDIRMARAIATTRGAHFRVTLESASTQLNVYRMTMEMKIGNQ